MGKCVCEDQVFCKRCYSNWYYTVNKEKILEYQKEKYQKEKQEKKKLTIRRGTFVLKFD